jgi:hypothetical protein
VLVLLRGLDSFGLELFLLVAMVRTFKGLPLLISNCRPLNRPR